MSEIKITLNSLENTILKDGSFVCGKVNGNNSLLLSINSVGTFIHGMAKGDNSSIKAKNTAAIARGKTNGNNSYIYAQGINAMALGYTKGENNYIEAFGNGACACGKVETEKENSYITASYIKANGAGSIARGVAENGYHIETSGKYIAHAEGYAQTGNIHASGFGAHAEGYASERNIDASGCGAHAEGISTHALADGAHAEGYKTTVTVDASYGHVEGLQTTASGVGAHAEGYALNGTIDASGRGAHAGGYANSSVSIYASGDGSFAHGYVGYNGNSDIQINASGRGAFAGGDSFGYHHIKANGHGSFAWGYAYAADIIADASGAVAFGIGTNAFNEGMMAVGKYNIDNIKDPSLLFVVGNGKDANIPINKHTKSNAFWVKDTGTAHSQNGFYDESDIRKKDILSNISLEKSYELLDKCQEIIYTLKEDPNKKELVGMIAQEVEEFFPEIVSTDNNGFKSLDYARLSVICLRLIKDLNLKYFKLEKEINLLKNKK